MKNSNKFFIRTFALIITLLSLGISSAFSQINITIPNVTGTAGSTGLISITVSDLTGQDVHGFSFTMYYDKNVIHLTGATTSGLALTGSNEPTVGIDTTTLPYGRLGVSWARSSPAITGSGTFIILNVTYRNPGTTTLTFVNPATSTNTFNMSDGNGFSKTGVTISTGSATVQGLQVRFESVTGVGRGDTILIPISTTTLTTDHNVNAFEFSATYNPSVIHILSAQTTGTLGSGGTTTINQNNTTGTVTVAWARATSMVGTGNIIYLKAKVVGLGISNLNFTSFKYNDGIPSVTTSGGTVTSINRAPSINAISPKTVAEDSLLTFTAVASDPDEGDVLTFSLPGTPPTGASIDANTGVFSWTPGYDQAGVYNNVTYKVTDSLGLSDSTVSTITVTNVNRQPGSFTTVSPTTETKVLLNWGDASESRTFTWRKAVDPDAEDTVRYTLKLGTVTFTPANDGKDTSITLSPTSMISALGTIKKSLLTWSVVASDGIATTNSDSASIYIFNNTELVSLTAARGTLDANRVPSTLNDTIKVAGVVTTVNFQTNNTDYMFQSGGVGFRVFTSGVKTFALGDSIQVAGKVTQYYGHTQVIAFDTSHMRKVGTKAVPAPLTITIANLLVNAETHESRLIKINNVTKVSGDWPALGQSKNINITDDDGVSQLVLRIDSDTDIDGSAEPKYPVNITGVAAQFDGSPPYDEGYQIMPSRREFDFTSVNLLPPATLLVSPANNTQFGVDGAQNYTFTWRSVTDPNIPPDQVLYRWEWVEWLIKFSTTDTSYARSGTELQSLIPVNQASITRGWFATTTDSTGNALNQRTTSDTFTVILNNLPPRITHQSVVPESIHINQAFTFSVTAVDPTADPLTYKWFVDGALTSTGPDSTFTHTFAAPSTKIVKVIVADNRLGQDSVSWSPRVVSVDGDGEMLPREFTLAQNYPNPFNPSTTIKFGLPKESHVMLRVYNLIGQEVATLINETKQAGYYSYDFNASSVAGGLVSGIYIYKITAGDFTATKKMTLMK